MTQDKTQYKLHRSILNNSDFIDHPLDYVLCQKSDMIYAKKRKGFITAIVASIFSSFPGTQSYNIQKIRKCLGSIVDTIDTKTMEAFNCIFFRENKERSMGSPFIKPIVPPYNSKMQPITKEKSKEILPPWELLDFDEENKLIKQPSYTNPLVPFSNSKDLSVNKEKSKEILPPWELLDFEEENEPMDQEARGSSNLLKHHPITLKSEQHLGQLPWEVTEFDEKPRLLSKKGSTIKSLPKLIEQAQIRGNLDHLPWEEI